LFTLVERVDQLRHQLTEEDLPAENAVNELFNVLSKRFPTYREDFRLLASLDKYQIYSTDLYKSIVILERNLHGQIIRVLKQQFGEDGDGWWHQGVPSRVQSDCEGRRKNRINPAPPWEYTTFAHLKHILEDNWLTFRNHLPHDIADDKQHFLECLDKLRAIRNRVMHPVGHNPPTTEDFSLVRRWLHKMAPSQWR
jgi:hypothetical protein